MKLAVNGQSPLGIKDQVKRQIRILIESSELAPDQALPSARDLAAMLNINRNTVTAAYRELASEGWLRIVIGVGTFVEHGKSDLQSKALKEIISQAVSKAQELGLPFDQIIDHFISHLSAYALKPDGKRILVVDCNPEAVADISQAIKSKMNVETIEVLMGTLEADPAKAASYLEGIDLVVCGLSHIEEFKSLFPENTIEVVAVMFRTDLLVMNELLKLPAGSKVGMTCVSQRSTEGFYKNIDMMSGTSLVKIWAGLDNLEAVRHMIDQCDVIFASQYVYDRILEMAKPGKRVIKVPIFIDPANIDLVRERLLAA